MQYSFEEIHALSVLDNDPAARKRFNLPRDLMVLGWMVVLVLAAVLIAAITLKVDKLVPAKGMFETELGLFSVRNMQAGHVQRIAVKVGSQVRAGQTLVELDARPMELEIAKARSEMELAARSMWFHALQVMPQLHAEAGRTLMAKLHGIKNPLEATSLQQRLQQQVQTVKEVYAVNKQSAEARAIALRTQMELQAQVIRLQSDEVKQSEKLVAAGFESAAGLANKQRLLYEARAREKALVNELQAITGESSRLTSEQIKELNELALNHLRLVDEALATYRRASLQVEILQRQMEYLTLRAPFNGTVDQLMLRGPQEFVPENASLLTLRRTLESGDLEINISLPASLAVWVRPGMAFRASAAGNNPEDHGFVRGVVDFVSNSTELQDRELNFRLKGHITEFKLKNGAARETFLRPGMELQVEIITGERNLMSYLLDPIKKTLREAATEPN